MTMQFELHHTTASHRSGTVGRRPVSRSSAVTPKSVEILIKYVSGGHCSGEVNPVCISTDHGWFAHKLSC